MATKYRAEPGKVVVVPEIPPCDICRSEGALPMRLGIYDFRTIMGSWAHGCTTHYRQYRAAPTLGVGKGQRWITADQVE